MKITGSKGYADSLFGGKGADQIYGNDKADLLSAWESTTDGAKDQVFGGAGDDLISGFAINFSTPSRSDSRGSKVDGGADDDTLIIDGESKSKNTDLSKVHKAMDIVRVEEVIYNFDGATSKQKFTGTNASETIYVGENGSTAIGGNGNDYLFAGIGDDALSGGNGNDFLSAGSGRNTLTGGKGADYFLFYLSENFSYSNITDFEKGVDKIAIIVDTGATTLLDQASSYGDRLRTIDRSIDGAGFLDYDHGRMISRGMFDNDAGQYNSKVVYEQETGSFIRHITLSDGNGGTVEYDVLYAHLNNRPALTSDDFVFLVL